MVDISYKALYKTLCDMLFDVAQDYVFEVNELLSHFLKCTKAQLITGNFTLSTKVCNEILSAAKKRADGYPLQYIIGEWDFYGRSFFVGDGVLIPRADTETLIEYLLSYAGKTPNLQVLDLCSGSGCIAITLAATLVNPQITAVEKSKQAYEYLLKNIKRNAPNVKPVCADIFDIADDIGDFDIIVSNPPYLNKSDMESLQKEVSFEPSMALFGEDDGLYFYRRITQMYKTHLKKGGVLAYEIGINQQNQVTQILKENEFKTICSKRDLCGIIRVISAEFEK